MRTRLKEDGKRSKDSSNLIEPASLHRG